MTEPNTKAERLANALVSLRNWCDRHEYHAKKNFKKDLFLKLFPDVGTKNMICPTEEFLNRAPEKFNFDELLKKCGLNLFKGATDEYNLITNEILIALKEFKDRTI